MRLVIMFQVMQLLLQLLVVQLNCSSNYFYKNLHYFDSHLDCDYSYQKCKKTSTATAAPPPPAPNSTVLPQQWILPFYQHYLMITTLQLFLHLFGSADRVWVNSLPKIPGHDRIILFFIARRRNWSDWANPPPTTTTVNAHPL